MKHLYWHAPDYSYTQWMYEHDAFYRKLIEDERREREAEEQRIEAQEAELDARNPLMTKFTKQVIEALGKRAEEIFAQSVESRKANRTKEANLLYWKARDVADIKRYYEARLDHYRGL